ncbi:MAG: hypothetical protein GX628_02560 [Clostridiales bacterium]|nr:hypothetical protein [Clostridiales bacterium]
MLCQKCGINTANVFYKQNNNGKVTELALCSECAASAGASRTAATQSGGFFGDPFGIDLFSSLLGTPVQVRGASTEKVCPLCGSSYRELVSGGKVGCAKCYEVFKEELAPTVAKIHGRSRHVGRIPSGYVNDYVNDNEKILGSPVKTEEQILKERITALNNEQKKAVEVQNYERAAELRDEIRRLEGGKESN